MSLLQQIRADLDAARKNKNQGLLTILTTLYSEAAMVGKTKRNAESTDEEVLSVVRKFKVGVEEIQKIKGLTEESINEVNVYEKYLPQQFTPEQLNNHINEIILDVGKDPKNMGKVMGLLKAKYNGFYDGTKASQLVKELLA
ncbi:MAG: hypothetical protein EO766_11665 [Hydrotalea sp. AMD]|uniref:GatB/YqeY domain-containing protein n=1 Tax=Hydrotalea sp. AMD TaxID=2501297 RepID=UPI0010263135|nr:GatB/YqeY domain-containing protein [Hydrotalea sp. AMD]RWZ87186.1 MAG: hypothetical protein EO766_11665 [Hydrotalea sp. AMD]